MNLAFREGVKTVVKQIYKGMSDAGNFYNKEPGRSIYYGFWGPVSVAIFDEGGKESLFEEVTFKQRPDRSEGES